METKLIKIGNSFGVRIPKSMIKQYDLSEDIEIDPTENGILIKARKKARAGWAEKLEEAVGAGHHPDDELLEGFTDDFENQEWQW
jgi:antitoxin MazE